MQGSAGQTSILVSLVLLPSLVVSVSVRQFGVLKLKRPLFLSSGKTGDYYLQQLKAIVGCGEADDR